MDVLLDADVEDVVSTIINQERRIDILVNNAGMAMPGKVPGPCREGTDRQRALSGAALDATVDQVRAVFETNTISVFRVSKAVSRHMTRRKSGTIVVVGSVLGNV